MADQNIKCDYTNEDSYSKAWKVKKLNSIKHLLDKRWKKKYEQLASAVGEQEVRPSIMMGDVYTSAQKAISPITKEQIDDMTPEELLEYVSSWKPNYDKSEASHEGLAQVLSDVVTENVIVYSSYTGRLVGKNIMHIYIYYFLKGISAGLDNLKEINDLDWNSILILGQELKSISDIHGSKFETRNENYWGGIKRELLTVVETGLKGPRFGLPFDQRDFVWEIMSGFTRDPEPNLKYEKEYGAPNMEPVIMSINTVRGKAIHCVMRYAIWCDYHENKKKNKRKEIHVLPQEVKLILARILDGEKTKTIWSIIGWYLNNLIYLDDIWIQQNRLKIFPMEAGKKEYLNAVFEGYFSFSDPFGKLFRTSRWIIEDALEWALEPQKEDSFYQPKDRFVHHLMVYYWWGLEEFDDSNSLINKFFSKANVELRGEAIHFIGRSFESFTAESPNVNNVMKRLQELYDWRIKKAEESGKPVEYLGELKEYGWWVANCQFSFDWLISRLICTLKLTGGELAWVEAVLDRFPEFIPEQCELVAESTKLIIKGEKTGYHLGYWKPKLRMIFEEIKKCKSVRANELVKYSINLLGGKEGISDFRDLL